MAKAGIKSLPNGPMPGELVINEWESGDALSLKKGHVANFTAAQGGALPKGEFVRVAIKRYPMGGYYAAGNLAKITCLKAIGIDDKISQLNGRKGTIVIKNPDAIVENNPPSGSSGDHAGNILSNGAVKGDFVTFELLQNGTIEVTGILTDCGER